MELKFRQKASYGIGAIGKDMVYMVVSSYILYYYNEVLGMNSVFVGAVLMAARIFDAFNDPFMGIIVGKTKSRWGRFRPWILTGTILNAIVLYALFAVPNGMTDPNGGDMKTYLAVLYVLWGVTYTIMDIPYWSMIPAITEPGKQRENLSALARSCAGVGSAIPTVLTMLLVPVLGGAVAIANPTSLELREGFKWWILIIAVIFVIAEIICVFNVKEKNVTEMEVHKIGDMFKSLFKNDQALIVVLTIVLVNTALYLTSNLLIYYFTYDIDNTAAYSIFSAFGGAAQILAMMLFPVFRKKFSKQNLFKQAIFYEIGGYVLILLMAVTGIVNLESNFPLWVLLFIPGALVFMGSGLINVLTTVFLSDSIDYGELKNGKRDESIIFSMQTFVVKLASGFAVFFAGLSIDLVGLDQTEGATQSMASLMGLRLIMTLIPVAGLVVALILFASKFKLDEETIKDIMEQLKNKKNKKSW